MQRKQEGPLGRFELETQAAPRRGVSQAFGCPVGGESRPRARSGCQGQTARVVRSAVHWGLGVGGGQVPVRGVSVRPAGSRRGVPRRRLRALRQQDRPGQEGGGEGRDTELFLRKRGVDRSVSQHCALGTEGCIAPPAQDPGVWAGSGQGPGGHS